MKNKQALINVAEWLEAGAPHVVTQAGRSLDQFNMEYGVDTYGGECGTTCCIAGAIVQFEGLGTLRPDGTMAFFEELADSDEDSVMNLAAYHLGISHLEAYQLFVPWDYTAYEEYSEFSAARAAKVIRHFAETGKVDWELFDEFGNEE